MSRLIQRRWLACLLGAVNGLIYCGVVLQVRWYLFELAYRDNIETAKTLGTSPVLLADPRGNWIVFPFWFVLLFTVASYLAHRNAVGRFIPLLHLWQLIGLGAVTAWNVIQIVAAWSIKLLTGDPLLYYDVTSLKNPLAGPFSLGLVMCTNIVYAAVIQISVVLYTRLQNAPTVYDTDE